MHYCICLPSAGPKMELHDEISELMQSVPNTRDTRNSKVTLATHALLQLSSNLTWPIKPPVKETLSSSFDLLEGLISNIPFKAVY